MNNQDVKNMEDHESQQVNRPQLILNALERCGNQYQIDQDHSAYAVRMTQIVQQNYDILIPLLQRESVKRQQEIQIDKIIQMFRPDTHVSYQYKGRGWTGLHSERHELQSDAWVTRVEKSGTVCIRFVENPQTDDEWEMWCYTSPDNLIIIPLPSPHASSVNDSVNDSVDDNVQFVSTESRPDIVSNLVQNLVQIQRGGRGNRQSIT